jgi:PTS system mannose-specific IIC component
MISPGALLPLALLGAVIGLDVVSFPQAMISRPIVAATITGAFVGSAGRGLLIGAVLELFALEMLAVGASRYPEWGTAAVVGATLFASAILPSPDAGALVLSTAAALLTGWAGGWSMYLHRQINGLMARRSTPSLERGSPRTVTGLQVAGLSVDLLRGALLTTTALSILTPLATILARRWTLTPDESRAALLALAAAVAGSATWRLFHGFDHARRWFVSGLVLGLLCILLLR